MRSSATHPDIHIGAGNQILRRVPLNLVILPFSQMRIKGRKSWDVGAIVELQKGEVMDNT